MKLLSLIGVLKKFVSKKCKIKLIYFYILSTFLALMELVSIGALYPLLSVLVDNESWLSRQVNAKFLSLGFNFGSNLVPILLVSFIVLTASVCILRLFLLNYTATIAFEIGSSLKNTLFKSMLSQEYIFYSRVSAGEIVTLITQKSEVVINYVLMPILILISSSTLLFMFGISFLYYDFRVALCTILFIFTTYLISRAISKRVLREAGYVISNEGSLIIKIINEALLSIKEIILSGSKDFYREEYKNAEKRLRQAESSIAIISAFPKHVVEAAGVIVLILIALISYLENYDAIIPVVGVIALAAQRVLPQAQQFYWAVSQLHAGKSTLEVVLKNINFDEFSIKDSHTKIIFEKEISIENISFRYGVESPYVIKNVSLKIPKGAKVGIIGTSGIGKSTFLDLLMGLYLPNSGNIFLDGIPLCAKNLSAWRAKIAHVPQEVRLIDGTFLENIALRESGNADYERLRKSCIQADCLEFIEKYSNGFDSMVGDGGGQLSGGQKQRIIIARAFYRNANVLFFDEPTSALDMNAEIKVINTISENVKEATIFMVSHNVAAFKQFDYVYDLNKKSLL